MATTAQRYWFIDKERIGIVERVVNAQTKEGVTTDFQPVSEAKPLIIYTESLDADLTDAANGTYSNIPDRFVEGIVAKVIADCYRDPRNMNMEGFQLYEEEYIGYQKLAKKWKRSNYSRTGNITPHEF